ncbi:MAG: phosphoenolpyruvate carboxylase [Chitinophagaceae bacterium]
MNQSSSLSLQQFKNLVGIKFQLYNSLFTSLPFHRIEKTGILLSLLLTICEEGYKKKLSPSEIIEDFFKRQTSYTKEQEKLDLLFRFVQYVERQVVLFDALEDASFAEINDMSGPGTLKHLESEVVQMGSDGELSEKLKHFGIRLVLTAHPTQFYPGSVLGIINDLAKSVKDNNVNQINMYLQQLGKTPFFKKQKPTPYDEAISLIWYLENVFYNAGGKIVTFMKSQFPEATGNSQSILRMGFWPGGDRDGNPFVTASITRKVADALRGAIIKCYYLDVRKLRRRLTFEGVDVVLQDLENKLYNNIFIPGHKADITSAEIMQTLKKVRETVIYQHNGLFVHLLNGLINRLEVFGLYFATLDIRQDSSVHEKVLQVLAETSVLPVGYTSMDESDKIAVLGNLKLTDIKIPDNDIVQETLESVRAIKYIHEVNGEEGCNRYIISQCSSALNVMEVFGLFKLGGWQSEDIKIDIVPLFETIDDLLHAPDVMRKLYLNDFYRNHVSRRGNQQTIMLGFSDGTKDGGYLMANWSIYKAKVELTRVSKEFGIDVIFFDGRGGPPARGGGKTHKFYSSQGKKIANKEIHLTIQGQTVSSNFGTVDAAQFNIEQLIHAGISNDLFPKKDVTLSVEQESLINQLAEESFHAYSDIKNHPYFLEYLSHVSPLRFYSETNIGSRPAKRGTGNLTLKDLRAIPFVGAWSQLKQNVTGYYGVGTALKIMEEKGEWERVKKLYFDSPYFKTLMDNCEMAMKKCFFPLTAYLANDPTYGEIWNLIHQEYELTQYYVLKLSGKRELMADYPVEQLSVQMRERIVLPLTTIQQYAISKVREMDQNGVSNPLKKDYEKLCMRSSFGIINAGRNSA